MISYNVYPGWHLRRMIRDMMLYHIRAIDDPREQIRQARSLVRFLLETASEGSFYRMVLEEQAKAIQHASDGYLFHEYLEMDNHPVYFYEFVNRAETAGLKYLGETKLSAMQLCCGNDGSRCHDFITCSAERPEALATSAPPEVKFRRSHDPYQRALARSKKSWYNIAYGKHTATTHLRL